MNFKLNLPHDRRVNTCSCRFCHAFHFPLMLFFLSGIGHNAILHFYSKRHDKIKHSRIFIDNIYKTYIDISLYLDAYLLTALFLKFTFSSSCKDLTSSKRQTHIQLGTPSRAKSSVFFKLFKPPLTHLPSFLNIYVADYFAVYSAK